MAEGDEAAKATIPLHDEIEGDRDSTSDFVFTRIGAAVPLKPSGSAFDLQSPPSQPIALSHRHRLLFSAHSQGFFVARTGDVIETAKEIKEKGKMMSVEDVSVVDVKIGRVSILAVSRDESVVTAAVGGQIFFFSVDSLLKKVQKPLSSCSLSDHDTVKDFKWQKSMGNSFVVLSSHGLLDHGVLEAELENVMDNVDAVDWSTEGGFVAAARKHILTILSSNFKEILSMSLFFESWSPTSSEYTIKVDTIKWLRGDSIIIGCLQVNEDCEEEGYLVQVIKSKKHNFSEVSCDPIVYSFPDLFDGIWDILPIGRGPYLLANYLDYWEVVLASNQKAIDQHISLMKWSMDDNRREVVFLEFLSDKYIPKIEVTENGDDNLVLGFCVEKFSSYEKIEIKVDLEVKEISPRYALLCLTSDGKLNLFHAARISESSDLSQTSLPLNDDNVVKGNQFTENSSDGSITKQMLKENVEDASSRHQLKQMVAEAIQSRKDKFELQRETVSPQRKQEGDGSQVGLFTGQIRNFNKSSMETPAILGSGLPQRNAVKPGINMPSNSFADIGKSDAASAVRHASIKHVAERGEVVKGVFGSTSIGGAPFGSLSAGKFLRSDATSAQSTSPLSRSIPSDVQEKSKSNSISSGFRSSDIQERMIQEKTKYNSDGELQLSMFSSGGATQHNIHLGSLPRTGNAQLLPTVQGSNVLAQGGNLPENPRNSRVQPLLENFRASKFPQMSDSGPEISKQFYNVKNMAQELDALLSFIEKEGGIRDKCTVSQRSSLLALENGLGDLSEISSGCRKNIEVRLLDIQQLQNKMLEVSARQGYMKGIVEQASNKGYWDIRSRQKLNPELEAKRQNILNANQNLTNQIIELERHFNTLEINRFGESGRTSSGHTAFRSGSVPSRQKPSLQSVYNTLNSQLEAAGHLSECLSKQMSELNINSTSEKRQNITKELFESIGLSHEITSYLTPACKRPSLTSDSVRRTPSSMTNAIKENPRKIASSVAKVSEPETARRRRDSLDRNWSTFEPPKTTVKRNIHVQRSRGNEDVPFRKAKEAFDSQMDAFAIQQKSVQDSHSKHVIETRSNLDTKGIKDIFGSSQILVSKSHLGVGTQKNRSVFSSPQSSAMEIFGSPDISSVEANRVGNLSNPFAAKTVASSIDIWDIDYESSPVQTSSRFSRPISPKNTRPLVDGIDQPSKNLNLTSGFNAPAFSVPQSTKHLANSSKRFSSITNETSISSQSTVPVFSFAGLTDKTTSSNRINTRNQSSESISNLASPPKPFLSTSSLPVPFSSSSVSATTSTTPSLTSKNFGDSTFNFKAVNITNQTAALESTSTSTASSQSLSSSSLLSSQSENSVIQTNTPEPPYSLSSKPFSFSVFETKSGESNQLASVPTSTSNLSSHSPSSFNAQFSQSQISSSTAITSLSIASGSATITKPTAPVKPATVDSPIHSDNVTSNSQPASTISSALGEVESAPKNEKNLLPTISEIPSSTALLTTTTEKDNKVLDVSPSREDEMEEEAPDTTPTLNLGSLGGFGLGPSSTPSSAAKPNPFGGSFLTTNPSTSSPPITLTTSPGEPFRPASFSLPTAQPAQQQTSQSQAGGHQSGGFSGFGQKAQLGVGQQALGSVLGSFGQSRQIGTGFPSSSGFGGVGGFPPAANTTGGFALAATGGGGGFASPAGGGFAAAAKGGGFAGAAAAGGGFSAVAPSGGFASAATGGGVFGTVAPSGGFAAAAAGGGGFSAVAPSGGFASAATAGGGFGATAPSGGFASAGTGGGGFGSGGFSSAGAGGGGFGSGGFGSFGNNQGGGGFSAFGGNTSAGAGKPPPSLLTQMRK